MITTGRVLGVRTYSFVPEGKNVRYEGYQVCIAYTPDSDGTQGEFAQVVSISFGDIGTYVPQVDDLVRYHTYRDEHGKIRCGFILPL